MTMTKRIELEHDKVLSVLCDYMYEAYGEVVLPRELKLRLQEGCGDEGFGVQEARIVSVSYERVVG